MTAGSGLALDFVKVEGLGNDFLILDARGADVEAVTESIAPAAPLLCDRRRGVGGDGLLIVGDGGPEVDATMRIVNADGSRPEMCGNGLRCAALWLARGGLGDHLRIATDAGVRVCTVTGDEVDVDMGPAQFGDAVVLEGRRFARVSMGNPHAVAFVGAHEDPEALARTLGPGIERASAFPDGTNVEFAKLVDGAITLWVWERGCGITQACGTGACATAAAAAASGAVPTDVPVRVDLPGGSLWITAPREASASVRMRGPARVVFEGRWTTT